MTAASEPRIRKVYTPPSGVGLYFGPEDDMSDADIVARMDPAEREKVLGALTEEETEALTWDNDFWLRPSQKALVNSTAGMTVALAGRGWGKGAPLSHPIMTPKGWSTVGDLVVGDQVFGVNGAPVTVTWKSPLWLSPDCFEVTFSDGAKVVVNAEHEWVVETIKRPKELVIDTKTLYETYRTNGKRREARYRIPMPDAVELPERSLPMHPYVMGVWLGGGGLHTDTLSPHIGEADDMWGYLETCGYINTPLSLSNRADTRKITALSGPSVLNRLDEAGVLHRKHFPTQYLRASIKQRMELLRGICDADGHIDPTTGEIEITTADVDMADGVSELLTTLGIKHSVNENDIVVGGIKYHKYRVIFHAYDDMPVFRTERKRARQKPKPGKRSQSMSRYVVDVHPVGSVTTQCIGVDAADHQYLIGSRGVPTHNSHVLSIAIHQYAMRYPDRRLLLLGRTTSDVRDVMIYGASGIMSIINPAERPTYNPATRKLKWPNGTIALCYSAERPDSLRGIQSHASFCDEVAAYRSNPGAGLANAFDQVKLLTRLPFNPPDGQPFRNQIFVATTPKRVPMILDLVRQAEEEGSDKVLLVRGPTRANRALSEEYQESVEGMFAGTAIGKQELEGEILTDVEGALLSQDVIDGTRIDDVGLDPNHWADLPYRVVGVDPSVASVPNDECGIVVVGATAERKMYRRNAYVLEDASLIGAPAVWAKKVVEMARKYRAVVVAEKNQGGELVRMVIQAEDPYVSVVLVHAAVSKAQRAEPVGTAYERGAIQHIGDFPELEAQLTSWAPGMGMASPDRLDALVHAATSLLVSPPKEMVGRISVAGNPSTRHIGVQDHSPGGSKPVSTNVMSDDAAKKEAATGNPNQIMYTKVHRKKTLALGQRDLRLGGQSSYTAPNRFGRPNRNDF